MKILLRIGGVILLLLGAFVIFAHLKRAATVRTYYSLERKWSARGNDTLVHMEPAMLALGILGPARVRLRSGISFYLDPADLVPANILRSGEWQPEVWDSLAPVLPEGAVFLDVGAHIGYFSMLAARQVGATGRVVSFEPNPETLKLLRDNVEANKTTNVTVEPIACADRPQKLKFYAAAQSNTGASSLSKDTADVTGGAQSPREYTVDARPIDDVVRELGLNRVDAIKIDVEGAEVLVLRGVMETLRRFHPKLVLEEVPEHLAEMHTTVEDLTSLLKSLGYNQSKPLNSSKTDWEWVALIPETMTSNLVMKDEVKAGQLLRGFHGLESKAWRWTDSKFAAQLRVPEGASKNGAALILKLTFPDVTQKKVGETTLAAHIGGVTLQPQTFSTAGSFEYRRPVPKSALQKPVAEVEFTLDRYLKPPDYPSEFGVLVTAISLE